MIGELVIDQFNLFKRSESQGRANAFIIIHYFGAYKSRTSDLCWLNADIAPLHIDKLDSTKWAKETYKRKLKLK